MNGKDDENKITAIMIVEMMGRPKEHLIQSSEELVRQLTEEKGLKIVNKKINEPVLVKDQKDLFTTFSEIEIEVEDPLILAVLTFKYMPSHMEIVEPEKFVMSNYGYSDILNELTRRLHRYEELVRVMQMQMESQGGGFTQLKPAEAPKMEEKKKSKEKKVETEKKKSKKK